MEVFAEPESTICLRGRKMELPNEDRAKTRSDTFDALSSPQFKTKGNRRQIIKAFPPVSKTWFFQCGTAR